MRLRFAQAHPAPVSHQPVGHQTENPDQGKHSEYPSWKSRVNEIPMTEHHLAGDATKGNPGR